MRNMNKYKLNEEEFPNFFFISNNDTNKLSFQIKSEI